MRKFYLQFCSILFFSLAIGSNLFAQRHGTLPQDTLAVIGGEVLTARDLLERVELMPWPEKEQAKSVEIAKEKALSSLVAEKILAIEARRLNIGDDPRTLLTLSVLRKILVRDELYRREIIANIRVSEEQIRKGVRRFASELKVLTLGVRSRSDADSLALRLKQNRGIGATIEKLPPFFFTARDTVTVNFGGLDESFEEAAYSIGSSRVSSPFFSEFYGWTVLYLLERHENPAAVKKSAADRRHQVEQDIRHREERIAAGKYYEEVLRTKRANADSKLFHLFADSIFTIAQRDLPPGQSTIKLSEWVEYLLTVLQPHLNRTLVLIDEGGLTLGEVIEAFRYEQFILPVHNPDALKARLNGFIKQSVEGEILAREGLKRGFEKTKEVQHTLRIWSDYWLARSLSHRVLDTVAVTEQEALDFLLKNKEMFGRWYEVNVREVLTENLNQSAQVLDELQRGVEFSDLARRYSKRQAWASNGGESGFFPLVQHPEIGFTAISADTGAILGPLQLSEGYSIFKVLGKRKIGTGTAQEFDSLKHNIRKRLSVEKHKQTMNRYLSEIAQQVNVGIEFDRLKSVPVSPSNMFTRRYMGFGGMMTAVPMLYPEWEWIKEFEQHAPVIP